MIGADKGREALFRCRGGEKKREKEGKEREKEGNEKIEEKLQEAILNL